MWQGSWICLWSDEFVLQRVKSSRLVPAKKVFKHASLLYLCISEKVLEKAKETSMTSSICDSFGITDCILLKVEINDKKKEK